MSEGLDLIARQQPEFINDFPTGNISIGVTQEELTELETALKEHEQYKAIEEELGLPLKVWVYLAKKELNKDFSKVYIENTIDDERQKQRCMSVNGRPQRHIVHIDFDKKFFQLQGTSNEWCNKVPFSDYGKTISLTKEELE